MRIAYFDCFSGISGDMTLGALLDAGADEEVFRLELKKLRGVEFELRVSKVVKGGISATRVEVVTGEEHHHRGLNEITGLIGKSGLTQRVKERAISIFQRLAEAEAAVHGTSAECVHFHEVGAVDAIVDIVGSAIGLDLLGIEQIVASPLPMGKGFVECAHGKLPLPAPATVEILRDVPVYSSGIEGELITPTGASIVRTIASRFGDMPMMTVNSVGYGAGTNDYGVPNLLRVLIGEAIVETVLPSCRKVFIVETNIDDMNPEFYDSIFAKLFEVGALDVYLTSVYMKKNRPGTLLTAISPPDRADEIARAILVETKSFGVRISIADRRCLDRRWETVTTVYGEIRIKIGMLDGREITASPEYEDCKKAAEIHGVSVRRVYETAASKVEPEDV